MAIAEPVLSGFHPAVSTWFARRFPQGPTEAQRLGWESIASGQDTLIAAPTGSGKTLAGFLVAIDQCLRSVLSKGERSTSVIYVSPLKALTVDVQQNLELPLEEICAIAAELGFGEVDLRVAVRNGDTSQAARQAIVRDRPEIIVTTPESLYLLLTARRGREVLASVKTVIVDEIHAVARDKRGSHLALSLERLERLVCSGANRRPTRIGLSATQRPIATVARLLVGSATEDSRKEDPPRCQVIDVGHRRPLDLQIVLPGDELGAVMTNDQLDDIVTSLVQQISAHRTSLIFVNTRRMSERLAHLLSQQLEDGDSVASHHGSLSMQRRLSVEGRLRAGELRAVVATASLELGIDVGPIDLVCQLGSPRAIATFLQRVGRAEHRLDGVPKGRIYPLTRDELVECVALFGAVADGRLDALSPVAAPLDILAQQIVAEVAACEEEGISEEELFSLVRRAAPYAELSPEDFEAVVELMSEGVTTGRGRRGAYLHRDGVNGVLRARRGARLAATTSGGAIPDLADYRVVLEPEGALVGTVHEDFAVEAMAGDIFLLASNSWKVLRVEQGVVRVLDANGAPPTIPFWLGEAPARTDELALAVSELRELVASSLGSGGPAKAKQAVRDWTGVGERPADELIAYLHAALLELGALPSLSQLVLERFFDDAGGMQLVVHSPYGARINRGFGLALRKRFCRQFDFELQAAASDDAIVLSLGPQHSFGLEEVGRYLSSATVTEVLVQAVLATPIFASRWRWNLGRSLISPRFRGARYLPPAIQRMEADDLMAAIFPQLAACGENINGPIEIPDHPIVRQTLTDCCTEAIDLDGLVKLVGAISTGEVKLHCVDSTEASVLSHEILNGRPYTFLDDAPLEERRTRAVSLRRGIALEAHDLSALDSAIVEEVSAEVAPEPRDAEELHDLLLASLVLLPDPALASFFAQLSAAGRGLSVRPAAAAQEGACWWCATERRARVEVLFPKASFSPDLRLQTTPLSQAPEREVVLAEVVRGHLECSGPLLAEELAAAIGITTGEANLGLLALQARGEVLQVLVDKWCAKRIVQRIHSRQRDRTRKSYKAVTLSELMSFYLAWQHVAPGSRRAGPRGLSETVAQLQGIEAAVGAWEETILPARVQGYRPTMLDDLAQQGEISWGRLSLRVELAEPRRSGASPSRATPVALVGREHLPWLIAAARLDQSPPRPSAGAALEVIEVLSDRGALFFTDICALTGRLSLEIADALWDGVTRGLVTSDGFQAMRTLLSGRYRSAGPSRGERARAVRPGRHIRALPGRRGPISPALAGGRWSLLSKASSSEFEPDELAEAVALQLLERWGVLVREVFARESISLSWREILWALRRLEARGLVRGGRFVAGPVGEQFALPEALELLGRLCARPSGETVVISAADPLNLTGFLLPGARVPGLRGHELALRDGVVVSDARQSGRLALGSS